MKKISYYILTICSVAALAIGCDKEDGDTVTPSAPLTATIKGVAFAELDLTQAKREKAPAGTVITALIDADDLMIEPDSNMVSDKVRFTTTVDASGNYTLSVRARNAEVPVTITSDDFEYNQVINDSTSTRKVYRAVDQTVNVVAGKTTIIDIDYN